MIPDAGEIRKSFERDGFVVLRGLLPRVDILRMREYADQLVAAGDASPVMRYTQTAFDRSGNVKLMKISSLAENDPQFHALGTLTPVVDIVETLLGPGARRFRDVMIVKPGNTGGGFSYHQDSAYWDVEPKALVSSWISLGDVAEDGSCLKIVPGTHRVPLEHRLYLRGRHAVPLWFSRLLRRVASLAGTGDNPDATGSKLIWKLKRFVLATTTRFFPVFFDLQDFRIPPPTVDPAREKLVPVQAGDVVFFHSLLWHATGPNQSERTRYAEIISFMSADARVAGGGVYPAARGA